MHLIVIELMTAAYLIRSGHAFSVVFALSNGHAKCMTTFLLTSSPDDMVVWLTQLISH